MCHNIQPQYNITKYNHIFKPKRLVSYKPESGLQIKQKQSQVTISEPTSSKNYTKRQKILNPLGLLLCLFPLYFKSYLSHQDQTYVAPTLQERHYRLFELVVFYDKGNPQSLHFGYAQDKQTLAPTQQLTNHVEEIPALEKPHAMCSTKKTSSSLSLAKGFKLETSNIKISNLHFCKNNSNA